MGCENTPTPSKRLLPRATDADNGKVAVWDSVTKKAIWGTTTPKVQAVVSAAIVTPTFTNDAVTITAQAAALLLQNPSGTWSEGQALIIRIKDNGTAQTIAFDTNYRAIGVALPTTTVINKTLYLGIIYNATDSKWDILGVNKEA